jgi:hypothetical protein
MKKETLNMVWITTMLASGFLSAQAEAIQDNGEYLLYNTYYARVLGGNEANDGPALSTFLTNDSLNYVFVAEPSTLTEGYYRLRHKQTGKYLQASNATGNTWSIWFAGSLNATYNSFDWKLTEGIEGSIVSNRGEKNNGSNKCYVGADTGKESQTYINVYYDKAGGETSTWQIVPASQGLNAGRLNLYVDALQESIQRGEDVYSNTAYGSEDDKYDLAVALYNARSAVEMASLEQIDSMLCARDALDAAITNAMEGKYKIWISGSSFAMGETYSIAIQQLLVQEGESTYVDFIVRNKLGKGAVIRMSRQKMIIGDTELALRNDGNAHNYQWNFTANQVEVLEDDAPLGTATVQTVPVYTSAGKSAEWSVMGSDALLSYCPEIITSDTERTALMAVNLPSTLQVGANTDYHIAGTTPLTDSNINLTDDSAWLIVDNVRPSDFISKYLSNVTIKGRTAKNGTNCRVGIYLQGCVVIPHAITYKPFVGYSEPGLEGDTYTFRTGKADMTAAANNIRGFVLKRGYMACLATKEDGSGYSRVYVADHEDKVIEELPDLLDKRVSFIYVRPWNYVSKKGWCNTSSQSSLNTEAKLVGATWFYTWSADKSTQTDMEYVPMKAHLYWPSTSALNQLNSTALLTFNEPEHSEQHTSSTCSCGGTISEWTACTKMPDYLSSGMRIGSPSPTDASWLKTFIGHCNDMAYRCDFVAFHAYWGTNEASNADSWKSQLQTIYNNTKRPIWLTEWNNGASWTTESWPTSYGDKLTQQYNKIKEILNVLDNLDCVERYAIYNWDSYYRAMITWDSDKSSWWVTPAGQVYRDDHPTFAYKESVQFVPTGWFPSWKTTQTFAAEFDSANDAFVATVEDTNTDFTGTLVYQYKDEEGNWCDLIEETDRSDYDTSSRTHSFPLSEIENLSEITQGKSTLTMRASFTSLNGKSNVSPEITVTLPKALSPYDVNADGEVDVTDITCVAAMILYGDTTTRGDVNGDGVISVADITAIAEQLLRPENSIKISNKEADGEKGGEAAARR